MFRRWCALDVRLPATLLLATLLLCGCARSTTRETEWGLKVKPDELTVIAKSRIAEQLKSTMSTMPTGLLVTFSKEEILDLLAFLSSTK